jgi:hypothetical protein
LSYEPGAGVNDLTISSLGNLLLPALSHPDQTNPLFVDHVLLAVPGCMSLRPMEARGQCRGRPGWARAMAGATGGGNSSRQHHARCDARRWRESAACRWVIFRTPSVARWEWRGAIQGKAAR